MYPALATNSPTVYTLRRRKTAADERFLAAHFFSGRFSHSPAINLRRRFRQSSTLGPLPFLRYAAAAGDTDTSFAKSAPKSFKVTSSKIPDPTDSETT
jgi:hypothetical protein